MYFTICNLNNLLPCKISNFKKVNLTLGSGGTSVPMSAPKLNPTHVILLAIFIKFDPINTKGENVLLQNSPIDLMASSKDGKAKPGVSWHPQDE